MSPPHVRTRILPLLLGVALGIAACGDDLERPTGPGDDNGSASVAVDSDPRGGQVFLDGTDTGLRTPDTIRDVSAGTHEVEILLDTLGWEYSIGAQIVAGADSVTDVLGPLVTRCVGLACALGGTRGGLQMVIRPVPSLFFLEGQGGGIFWPSGSENSYASMGAPVLAGVVADGSAAGDTVALGPYDIEFQAGRPAPDFSDGPGGGPIRIPSWILPPRSVILSNRSVPRGLEIEERVIPGAEAGIEDLLFVQVVLRNISDRPIYRSVDPISGAGEEGLTLSDFWPGFALDFDVGVSEDDAVTYVPDLDLAVGYDSDFAEDEFSGGWNTRPALIGLRMVEAPAGAGLVAMNAWERELDWSATEPNQSFGLLWLSASQTATSDHPDPRIGFAPSDAADYRVGVASGPFSLAPGDSLSYTVAVMLAEPVEGSFTSGEFTAPGDPADPDRAILDVAAALVEKAEAAGTAWESLRGATR